MTEQDTGRSQRAEAQPPKAALSAEQKKLLQAKHRMEEAEEGTKPQNPAADPGRCDFGERISPGAAHGFGSAEGDSGEAIGYERNE